MISKGKTRISASKGGVKLKQKLFRGYKQNFKGFIPLKPIILREFLQILEGYYPKQGYGRCLAPYILNS